MAFSECPRRPDFPGAGNEIRTRDDTGWEAEQERFLVFRRLLLHLLETLIIKGLLHLYRFNYRE